MFFVNKQRYNLAKENTNSHTKSVNECVSVIQHTFDLTVVIRTMNFTKAILVPVGGTPHKFTSSPNHKVESDTNVIPRMAYIV